nr:hypothetical protein [uncultured Campylobacter sp.]
MEFYRDEISYGKISHSKNLDKILRQNFRAPYCKNRRKIGAKPRQDRRKILCGRGQAQRARIFCKIYDEISPPKARLRQPKTRSKIKKPPQNPHDEIPPANFSKQNCFGWDGI